MRLDESERQAIVEAILRFDPQAEAWLIGSRLDDFAKGGDIDLLVVSERISFSEKIDLLALLKIKLGDQKIDLTIIPPSARTTDAFARAVLPSARRL